MSIPHRGAHDPGSRDPDARDSGMRYYGHRPHPAWREGWVGPWHEEFAGRPPGARMSRRARLIIPAAVSGLIQIPPALFFLLRQGNGSKLWLAVVLVLAILGPAALLLARRFPGPVVLFVTLAACIDFLVAGPFGGPPFIALAFAIVSALARGARVWAWVSLGTVWVATVVVGIALPIDLSPARVAVTTLGILIVFGVGEAVRNRSANYAEFRRSLQQRRMTEVQAERVRIARELHDVLAHSLSQINVQASVALHLLDKQPEKASEALSNIKDTSKTALDEVRSVLGVLRAEDGQDPSAPLVPEPDLSRLPGLVASVTAQGVDVTLQNDLTDAPKAMQLAVYRIVQESLTNVVRHAHARSAVVTIAASKGEVIVTVADDGKGLDGSSTGGRGLLGMRERAELLGGSLETGVSPTGGLLVTARLPLRDLEGARP
jgi:signal transduction histidine kinase